MIEYKQYVIVPKSPNMSKGKIASQVAHATFLALSKQRLGIGIERGHSEIKIIEEWKQNGMCVIVLECEDTEHLSNVAKYLDQWDVPNWIYYDEGLTEVLPMTPTALATGVLTEDQFWMFEQFNLFGKKEDSQEIIDDKNNVSNYLIFRNGKSEVVSKAEFDNFIDSIKPIHKTCGICSGTGMSVGMGCPGCGLFNVDNFIKNNFQD